MTTTIYVKPAPGRRVSDEKGRRIADKVRQVPYSKFWRARLAKCDVTRCDAPAPAAPAKETP